jgi:16S rRNA processing protein RimM
MHIKALNIHQKPTRKVGFVLKPHGFNGNIRIALDDEDFVPSDFLLLEIHNKFVPYAIKHFNPASNIIKLEGIDKLEQAEELLGLAIITLEEEGEQQETDSIVGYTLTDKASGQSFEITGISYLPNNTLLEFRSGYKDHLIPLHEDLVEEINHETRTVLANFPDGILDL